MIQISGDKEGENRNPPEPAENEPPAAILLDKQPVEIQDAFSKLPEEDKRRLFAVLQTKSEIFQGPFPHPKHAAKYEELCPGFLERSLVMAERAQAASIENSRLKLQNERLALENERDKIQVQKQHDRLDSRDTARAQYLGFAALMALALIAAFLACFGHEKIAITLFSAAVIGFLGRIFVGKFSQSKKQN